MATLAEIGVRIGIPAEALEDLIELPVVADAIRVAGENPHWKPNSIWKGVGRPTLYTAGTGLNLDALYLELTKRRELATRATDGRLVPNRLAGLGPISVGRLQKAEQIARRRLAVIEQTYQLLNQQPADLHQAATVLRAELAKGGFP